MGPATQLVFPSTIIGSAILAMCAFFITAGISPPPVVVSANEPATTMVQKAEIVEVPSAAEPAPPVEGETGGEDGEVSDVDDSSAGGETQAVEAAVESEESTAAEANQEPEDQCKISKKYPDKIRQWCDLITKFSKKNGLEPDLVAALIWQESGGNPVAYSKSGAVGLMQVMPKDGIAANFMCVNGPCFASRPSTAELQDPAFNIKYGTGMLTNLVAKYGNMREALRYYGPRDVGYYYADKVLGIYENYRK